MKSWIGLRHSIRIENPVRFSKLKTSIAELAARTALRSIVLHFRKALCIIQFRCWREANSS